MFADPDDSGMVHYGAFVDKLFKDHAAAEKAKSVAKAKAK